MVRILAQLLDNPEAIIWSATAGGFGAYGAARTIYDIVRLIRKGNGNSNGRKSAYPCPLHEKMATDLAILVEAHKEEKQVELIMKAIQKSKESDHEDSVP